MILFEDLKTSFETKGDAMPTTLGVHRRKIIHTVGMHAKARFVPNKNNIYSGLFEGADNLIIRISQ